MQISPAHIDQIRRGQAGRMVMIDADAGGVAADLAAIDPGLKVRFAENGNPPYWVIFHEAVHADGRTEHHLVLTQQAHQSDQGIWTGLDQRVVDRVRLIDGHGRNRYDYARELDQANRRVKQEGRELFREQIGETAEQAAAAVRKDLGTRYKGRAFIPRDLQ